MNVSKFLTRQGNVLLSFGVGCTAVNKFDECDMISTNENFDI